MKEEHAAGASRAAAAILAGALLAALVMVAVGWLLQAAGAIAGRDVASGWRDFLAAGGWVWLPLWGAALGALRAALAPERGGLRLGLVLAALGLSLLPLAWRPAVRLEREERAPATPQAKMRAALRWSYKTPETVLRIVALSRDRDPRVREQAVLALGVNRIVTDLENASTLRPARHANSPVRDSLRLRLLECLTDSVEVVRAEAARALWKAQRTFGAHPAAAETLAAILERTDGGQGPERLAWLALDAAAGTPHEGLRNAAARFAERTPDPELRRAATEAASGRGAGAAPRL